MTADNDISSIFESNSIQQVEEILSKTRFDIERKKEDLRIMVGERYRDLIEAADTIASMQRSSEAICHNIENMESLCESLKQRGLIGFKTRSNTATNVYRFSDNGYQYSIAMQVKLLVDVPEILWGLTEKREFLNAAQLFLLSQHAYTSLQLSSKANLVLDVFPVISRQWSNISQFQSTIVKGCNIKIRHEINDFESILDAVIAIMLLDGCSMHQVLLKVLDLRKAALFSSLKVRPAVIAKTQLVEFIVSFISSLEIINYLFGKNNANTGRSTCIIENKMKLVSDPSDDYEENRLPIYLLNESSTGMTFLPKSVIEFRPTVSNSFQSLEDDVIQKEVQIWLKDVMTHSSSSISSLLSYTTSVKSLSLIRSGLHDAQSSRIEMDSWKNVVSTLLAVSSFNPWQSVIKDQVLDRCKVLIKKELMNTKDNVINMVKALATEIVKNSRTCFEEGDITSFVWSENASDLPDQVGWTTASSKQMTHDKSGLFYKSRGYTKRVQAVCKSLNSKLNSLLDDLFHFSPPSLKENNSQKKEMSAIDDNSAVQDYNELLQFLEAETNNTFKSCVNDLSRIPEQYLTPSGSENSEEGPNSSSGCTVLVIVSRLCHAFSVVCPQLRLCAVASLMINDLAVRRVNLGMQPDTESWISLKNELLSCSTTLMSRFLTIATESVSIHLKSNFLDQIRAGNAEDLLVLFSTWESISIEEEGESGKVVRSSICVPAYPSPALSEALMKLCSCVNCISSHTITRTSQKELGHQLCIRLMSCYEELLECLDIINQTTALQLIFDLKFIKSVLMPRDAKNLNERLSKLVQSFETKVDPFDLNVFHPHISSTVRIAAHRLQVLYGILLPKDRQLLIGKGPPSSSSSQANNALSIVPPVDIPRFSNVPLPASYSLIKSDSSILLGGSSFDKPPSYKGSTSLSSRPSAKDSIMTSSDSAVASSRSTAASLISSWFGGTS